MKINNKKMLKLLKEEYNKKIDYYLGEVETRAKHSESEGDLIKDAHGLKVKDKAGNVFVIDKLAYSESKQILVYLIPPGKIDDEITISGRDMTMHDAKKDSDNLDKSSEEENINLFSNVNEDEKKTKLKSGDIIKPNPKAKFKKNNKIKIDSNIRSYDEVDGRVIITLQELESDFTL